MGYFHKDTKPLAQRVAVILYTLFQRKKTSVNDLAEITGVKPRTTRRDLELITSANIPLVRKRGEVSLDIHSPMDQAGGMTAIFSALGRAIGRRFSHWVGTVLPEPSDALVRSLLLRLDVEDIGEKFDYLLLLEQAISEKRYLGFRYENRKGDTRRVSVAPVKIMVSEGRWFLAGWTDGKIKTFGVSKIADLEIGEPHPKIPESAEETIYRAVNVWFDTSGEPFETRLYVHAEAAPYVIQKPLAPTQKIVEYHTDGALVVSMALTSEMEILPSIRYWIPHIYPLAPKSLCEAFARDLEKASDFLGTIRETDR